MGRIPWQALAGQLRGPSRCRTRRVWRRSARQPSVTLGLAWLRSRFTWWPFHPVGYALGNTFELDLLWCQLLVGWLCKVITLRYGGIKAYRAALPFFIGLILGDYVIASIWTLLGVATGLEMYRCFPNSASPGHCAKRSNDFSAIILAASGPTRQACVTSYPPSG